MSQSALRLMLSTALMAGSAAHAATSSFAADAEGWTSAFNGGQPVVWADGAISVDDKVDEWAYLKAPVSFHEPIAAGGAFSFDLRHAYTGLAPAYGVRVALTSGSTTLITEGAVPTDQWKRYSFALAEGAGWRSFSSTQLDYNTNAPLATLATLNAVLAKLDGVYIATDYTNGNIGNGRGLDRSFIDNVALTAPVPEPQTWAMLAAGLLALGWIARRRSA
jgi:PEP-CTERM motif